MLYPSHLMGAYAWSRHLYVLAWARMLSSRRCYTLEIKLLTDVRRARCTGMNFARDRCGSSLRVSQRLEVADEQTTDMTAVVLSSHGRRSQVLLVRVGGTVGAYTFVLRGSLRQ